jgi:tetratricopeptide (TPR) repeat protein/tRNA A-37 threonylcarbamoyl transferase component Bud32
VPNTQELGEQLVAARPRDPDAMVEAIVAGRLFGPARAAAATVGRFTLIERIGRGGTSDVFAAYDPVLDRKVALKLLRTDAGVRHLDADERAWLLREARATARLSHPNVVVVHEVGELDDGSEGIWVAMEHIAGQTLRAWLRDERSLDAILHVFVHAGLGLAAAHDAGIVHRDFKPENVLVCGEGADVRGRVVDFGLARVAERMVAVGAVGSEAEGHSTLMGTPAYMSPEQLLRRPVDARSDQFAFCVALHEALTGQHPFGADRPGTTPAQLLERIVSGQRPTDERPLPGRLRRLLARGMLPEPTERHPSMHAVIRELRATPARRRRRLLVVAGAALVVGSSGLTVAGLERAARSGCAEAAEELEGVWDPSVRAAAQAAFVEVGLANADEVWERLEPRLDDYAEAWVVSREQTCLGLVGGTPLSPEHAALRNACLDRRRAELGGLTELLGTAQAPTVQAAIGAANRLTPIASCDDVESLLREQSLVGATEGSPAVDVLRQELVRRMSQVKAGHGPSLDATATALLARARELAMPLVVAEALMLRGLVDDARGDYDASAANLEAAALEAMALRHDHLHAEIATRLVWTHGVRLGRAAEAWVARAEAAIRASRGDPVLAARLLDHRGTIAARALDHATAVRLHGESTMIRRRISPQADAELGSSIGNLGLALLALGRHEEAMPLIEESLARFRDTYGPSHPDVAAMLSNLGLAHLAAGDPERAVAVLHEALVLRERLFGPDHIELMNTLNNLANALSELGRHHEARAFLRRGLTIGERALDSDDPKLVSLVHNLAFQAWLLGDHSAVVREASRVLALQERIHGSEHPSLALTLELLARGQLGLGDAAAASETIHRALALAEQGQLQPSERGSLLLSAAWIERANDAPPQHVRALATSARALLGDDPGPGSAGELAILLAP